MKLHKIVIAYQNFASICALKVSTEIRHKLKKLKDFLLWEFEFYCEEEQKIIEEYSDKDESGNAIINGTTAKVSDSAKFAECNQKLEELKNTEIECALEKILIPEKDIVSQPISLDEEEALQNFITFGGD